MCDEGLEITGVRLSFGTVGIELVEKKIQIQDDTARKYHKASRVRYTKWTKLLGKADMKV